MRKHDVGPVHCGDSRPKRGLAVEVRFGDMNGAIKRFNTLVKREGIIREIKDKEFYEKPSTKRRRQKQEAVRRRIKADRRNTELGL